MMIIARRMVWLLSACVWITPLGAVPTTTKLKQITVVDTNNYRLDKRYTTLQLPAKADDPYLQELNAYLTKHKLARGKSELEEVQLIIAWTHRRWQHASIGNAPPQANALDILHGAELGERYSCTEYSRVLRDVLHARGYPARILSLQSKNIAYGGLGSAHVAVEVWSNEHAKWFLADAQFGLFAIHQRKPIHAMEIYRLIQEKRLNEIEFRAVGLESKETAKARDLDLEYKQFIQEYFGFLSTNYTEDDQRINIILPLLEKNWPLTLQGLTRNLRVFARDERDMYIQVNQVALRMQFRPESQVSDPKAFEFNSEDEYLKKMPGFAAVPDFNVSLLHNMPWFSHYEFSLDDKSWNKLNEPTIRWTLRAGANRLAVRAVNAAGRKGPVTYYSIQYQ